MLTLAENERDRMLISLIWHTGGRISEVLAVRVGDITPTGIRMLNLKRAVPAEKHVFCPADFLAQLAEYCAGKLPNEHIITTLASTEPICRKTGWQIWKRTAARAGVYRRHFGQHDSVPVWPHSGRHGYAVNLLTQGVPITVIQAQLGHSNLSSTQVYAALSDSHRETVIRGARF